MLRHRVALLEYAIGRAPAGRDTSRLEAALTEIAGDVDIDEPIPYELVDSAAVA